TSRAIFRNEEGRIHDRIRPPQRRKATLIEQEVSMKLATRMSMWAVLLLAFGVSTASAVSTTIVIAEFRTRGPSGGNDEFVEILNKSAGSVNISGYLLRGSNNAGTISTRA